MDSVKMKTDTGEMRSASEKLSQLAEDYTTVYTRLLNTASTMGEAWKSPDNLAFVEQINGLLDELKAMAGHIEASAQGLEQQAANYEANVENNIAGVKKLVN